jgi:5-(carboxyamino)imidazole ribonucleotide mutase
MLRSNRKWIVSDSVISMITGALSSRNPSFDRPIIYWHEGSARRNLPAPNPGEAPLMCEGAQVAIAMGSDSDLDTLRAAEDVLAALGIPFETAVVSAHRTPERMFEWARGAAARGIRVVIAGAGGAAHLPGMIASLTLLPVLGVPVQSRALQGLDSLLSIVQMPAGVPTATFAIGAAGAANAALFAARILALGDDGLADRVAAHRRSIADAALAAHQRVAARSESEETR